MTQQNPIRWGIIGAGNIASKLADAVQQNPNAQLISIASKSPDKAKQFADKYQIIAADSYEALVNRDDIDIIYVATTHNFHFDNTCLVLNHGKHALVEKPFTVNAKQAIKLKALAQANNLFLMEAIWIRYLPSIIRLKQIIKQQTIGKIKYLNASFGGFAPAHYQPRLTDPNLAGGVTLDMGIYPITLINFLLDEMPNQVTSLCQFSQTQVDELAVYQFSYASGCMASIGTSFNLLMQSNLMIYGTKGYIEFNNFQQGQEFKIYTHEGSNDILATETITIPNDKNGFIYQVEEVNQCIYQQKNQSDSMPIDETIATMQLMDEMRSSWNFKYPFE